MKHRLRLPQPRFSDSSDKGRYSVMNPHKEIVINISPEGQTSALHMDEFPLSFLGRMEIDRASTIDFNPETQLFDINLKNATKYQIGPASCPPHSRGIYDGRFYAGHYPESARGFAGYDEARCYEVSWIQECMKLGVDPLDPEGIEVINALRVSGSPQL